MTSKSLIVDVLSSVPSKRQAVSFLNRTKRTIVVVDSEQKVQHKISKLARLNVNPIVLFKPKSSDFHNSITDAYQFMESMPLGIAMKDLGDPELVEQLEKVNNSGNVPVILSATVEDNQVKMLDPVKGIELLCNQLAKETSSLFKIIVFNNSGGMEIDGQPKMFHNFSSKIPCPRHEDIEIIQTALKLLPLTASGLLIASLQPQMISSVITDKPPRSAPPEIIPPTVYRWGVKTKCLYGSEALDKLDLEKLTSVLESSFAKPLDPGYFDSVRHKINSIVIAGDYQGAMIFTNEPEVYLDKFAVMPEAQGFGIADILWSILVKRKRVFWRSRSDNPVNGWYYDRSNGHLRAGYWTLFWHGDYDIDEIQILKETISKLPASFLA